jgi:hypothetical protein
MPANVNQRNSISLRHCCSNSSACHNHGRADSQSENSKPGPAKRDLVPNLWGRPVQDGVQRECADSGENLTSELLPWVAEKSGWLP